ncbi:hypothetical protein [Lysobacter sp. Hz 25]|uniref:hypothetical protein n=1 Tax=Lysobacter sp. Hz 25 TaxID=3383698 RepID=UPI0038D4AA6B
MQTSIKLRRNWAVAMAAVPLHELAVAAMNGVPGIRSARMVRVDGDPGMTVVEMAFEWFGEGQPEVPEQALKHFGLTRAE